MKMRADQVSAFVEDVVATGCEICAVGHEHFVFGDADLPPEVQECIEGDLQRIICGA